MQVFLGTTILVTGGAGFIGSHVCEAFLKQNLRVVCVDNFNDFYDPNIKRHNIEDIKKFPNSELFICIEADIRNSEQMDKIFADYKPEIIVHLAAYAGVRPSIANPALYYDVNVNGTLVLLECMKKHKISRLIFASSSSVYGNNKKLPFSELDSVDNPISPYAASKKAGELICHVYHQLNNFNIACLRFFTVYGPRQRPDLAIHKFTSLIQKGESIPFFGDGLTERDYTYIDDIVKGVVAATKWTEQKKPSYNIFNLGESCTISLAYMLKTIENALNKKATKELLPMQPGDVEKTYADIDKAKNILGYNPSTNFEQGISKFVDWYKSINL